MLTVPPTLNFSINACRAGETGRGLVHRPEAKNFNIRGFDTTVFLILGPTKKEKKKKTKKNKTVVKAQRRGTTDHFQKDVAM